LGAAALFADILSSEATKDDSKGASWSFTPRVSGIPVTDATGRPISAPFLGGFDVPRPQLVDINGDGTLDLFLQERPGELMLFERAGDDWMWKTDRFENLDIGEWYRFADVDADGKVDLLSEMRTGYVRVWRNDGTKTAPHFVALGDTIRDVDGRAIVADRQNILNAVDIDCNGKLDLFIGRVQGVVDRYEREGNSPDGSPRFRLLEESWQGIEVIGPEVVPRPDTTAGGPAVAWGASHMHGANTLAFADIDKKGTLDLFWGDFFEEGLLRFENTGSCARPDLTGKPARFPDALPLKTSGYNAATFGDVDGDGHVDLVMGVIGGAYGPYRSSIDNLYYLRQAPKESWAVKSARLIPTIDVGSESAPALGDVNGDGLLDLVVGSKVAPTDHNSGTLTWFENVGSATQPAFRERGRVPIQGQFNYAPAIADLDADGLADLVLGAWSDRVLWYRNTGSRSAPSWTLADSALVTITRGTNTTPTLGDLDGDGLLDLVVGEASGVINLYRNVGTRTAPKFALVSDHFQDIKVGRRSAPVLADMDGDGRLDIIIGSDDGTLQLWRGVPGTESRFVRDDTFIVKSHPDAIPAVGELHRKGRPDILVGTLGGGLRWFENGTP
jgi:uncharacterized protein (DUF2141 family)